MKIGKKMATLAIAAALLFGMAAAGNAQQNNVYGDYYDMQPNGMPQLSPAQQNALQQILKDNFTTTDSLRKELTAKRQELQAQLQSANPDKAKVGELSRDIGDLRGKMLSAHVDMRAKLAQAGIPSGPAGAPDGSWQGGNGYWGCPGWGCPSYGWGRGWGPHGGRHHGGYWGPGMMMGPMMGW